MPQFPSYLPYPPHGAPDAPQSGQGDPGGSPNVSDLREALAQPSRLAQQEQFLLRGGGGVAAPRTLLDAPPASPGGPLGLGAPGGPLGLGQARINLGEHGGGPPTSGGLGSPQGTMNQVGHQGGPPVSVGNARGVSAVGNFRGTRAPQITPYFPKPARRLFN
jgi:hypothetical protein